ncbi:MAG: four helix bundle protein [Candidatus Angelobacter sp.]
MASMTPEQLRNRTQDFALRIVKLFRSLPRSPEAQVIGKQLLRSGTSVWSKLQGGMPLSVESRIYCQNLGLWLKKLMRVRSGWNF